MNCNTQAFEWIVEVTKIKHNMLEGFKLTEEEINKKLDEKFAELTI